MSYLQRLTLRLGGITLVVLLAALLALGALALKAFERDLIPEVENKTLTLGRSVAGLIARAGGYGITVNELVGVEDLFRDVINDNREIGLLVLTDPAGKPAHQSGPLPGGFENWAASATPDPTRLQSVGSLYLLSLPIDIDGQRFGVLHVGARADFVQSVLKENLLDVIVVLVVAFFVAVEIAYFFAARSALMQVADLSHTLADGAAGRFERGLLGRRDAAGALSAAVGERLDHLNASYQRVLGQVRQAIRARHTQSRELARQAIHGLRTLRQRYRFEGDTAESLAARLGLVRAPLFLFLVADDLSRAFMPIYAAELFTPIAGLSVKLVQGLPIMLFMLVVGLSQPLMGSVSERLGRRKLLLAGALVGAVSHLGAAFAFSLYDLLAWRALAGLAWGVMFVAGQGFVLDHTNASNRTRGLAFFVGVIMVASACGPSIGGILAEGIGHRPTLILAALLAALAAALVWLRLPADPVRAHDRRLRAADFFSLLANKRFMVFLLTAAMPAKIILIGVCFYLIPLYIPDLGSTAAMAGRLIMLYAVVMVIGVPFFARWSGKPSRRAAFVAGGILVSALAAAMPLVAPGVTAVALMVILLGIGQSLSIAPQTAMVSAICEREVAALGEGAVLGIYRLMERLGNVLGPLLAAALLTRFDYTHTFAAIAALMLLSALAFALTFNRTGGRR